MRVIELHDLEKEYEEKSEKRKQQQPQQQRKKKLEPIRNYRFFIFINNTCLAHPNFVIN